MTTKKKRAAKLSAAKKQAKCRSLARRDGDVCHYCHRVLTNKIRTLDHIIPLADGGSNELRNLVLACYDCNHRRGDTLYIAFIKGKKKASLQQRPFVNMDIELAQITIFEGDDG